MKKFANAPIVLLVALFCTISLKPAFPQGTGIFLENATIGMGLVTVSPSKVEGSAPKSADKPRPIGNIRLETGSPGELEASISSRQEKNARLLAKVSVFESPGGIKGGNPGGNQMPGNDIREDSREKTIKKPADSQNPVQPELTAKLQAKPEPEIARKSADSKDPGQSGLMAKLQAKPEVKPVVKLVATKPARYAGKRVKRVAVKPARYAGKRVKRVATKTVAVKGENFTKVR